MSDWVDELPRWEESITSSFLKALGIKIKEKSNRTETKITIEVESNMMGMEHLKEMTRDK